MGRSVVNIAPQNIRGEEDALRYLMINHLMHISVTLSSAPSYDEFSGLRDARPQTLFYCVRLLDCWLSPFASKDYEKKVKEEKYREKIILPDPRDEEAIRTAVKRLFEWHDIQAKELPRMGISPKIKDSTPLAMQAFIPPELEEEDLTIQELDEAKPTETIETTKGKIKVQKIEE